jgi:type I restriction enzyme S subunit
MAVAKTIKNNVEMSWEKVRLGDVAKLVTGKTPPTNNSEYFNGEYIWVNPSDFGTKYITNSKRTLTSKAVNEKKCNLLPANSILLSCIGDIGKVGILKSEGTSNQQITALISNSKIHPDFLYYYLMYKKSEIEDLANKAVVAILNNERLKEFLIPLPPLATQKRIADILDTADALRRKDQELLTKYDQLAQAIFIDMFGDPVKNEKGWEVKKLGDCIDFMTSGSRGWAQYYSDEGEIFLRINNVGYNQMKLNDLVYVKAPNSAEAKRTLVSPNDMLLSITADLGRTCIIPEGFPKSYINQHLAILRFQKEYQPKFISQLLASEYGKLQFMKLNKGGVKAGLNFDDIKSIEFLNPKISLQKKYIEIIDELQKQVKNKIECNSHSTSLFSSLIQQAFNGTLVS